MIGLAAIAAAVVVLLAWPASGHRRWSRLAAPAETRRGRPWLGRMWPAALPVLGVSIGLVSAGVTGVVLGLCAGLVAATAAQLARTQLHRRRVATGQAEVVSACRLLGGLLRVGQVPAGALQLAAGESAVIAEAAAAQRAGGSVAEALRAASLRPGRVGLGELAVAWELAERTGASMTAAIDGVVERQEAAAAVADVVASELAAPRATGRLLAVLPLAGLALGFVLGGDPVAFLLGSPIGSAGLVGGVVLACVGVLWTDWLARPEVA